MPELPYPGRELEVFAIATNWKSYVRERIRGYLVGKVLEVGAGIGAATQLLYDGTQLRWVCLEPDGTLAQRIPLASLRNSERCEVRVGTLADLAAGELFSCIVYMDVLEHIQDDAGELERACRHLERGGHLIVLSPALGALYTEFDVAIGHYRRYTKASLRAIAPRELQEEICVYLDCIGALLSLANRLVLHSATPNKKQILFWDRFLVPISCFTDGLAGNSIGRSILAVWKKPANSTEKVESLE
jgi:SAM-dependent methyltransferase